MNVERLSWIKKIPTFAKNSCKWRPSFDVTFSPSSSLQSAPSIHRRKCSRSSLQNVLISAFLRVYGLLGKALPHVSVSYSPPTSGLNHGICLFFSLPLLNLIIFMSFTRHLPYFYDDLSKTRPTIYFIVKCECIVSFWTMCMRGSIPCSWERNPWRSIIQK